METIKIKYHTDIPKIEEIAIGDWIDLRSAEDVQIEVGEEYLISLGVSMKLPDGYEAHVAPRSSTFKNYGIIMTNGIGIIDNSYCGTNDIWRFPAYCLVGHNLEYVSRFKNRLLHWLFSKPRVFSTIRKGDRICQFRIVPKQPKSKFEEVEVLEDTDRGGFGSTGTK